MTERDFRPWTSPVRSGFPALSFQDLGRRTPPAVSVRFQIQIRSRIQKGHDRGNGPEGSSEAAAGVVLLDKDGNELRYKSLYSHEIHGLREAPVPMH